MKKKSIAALLALCVCLMACSAKDPKDAEEFSSEMTLPHEEGVITPNSGEKTEVTDFTQIDGEYIDYEFGFDNRLYYDIVFIDYVEFRLPGRMKDVLDFGYDQGTLPETVPSGGSGELLLSNGKESFFFRYSNKTEEEVPFSEAMWTGISSNNNLDTAKLMICECVDGTIPGEDIPLLLPEAVYEESTREFVLDAQEEGVDYHIVLELDEDGEIVNMHLYTEALD